ncbi:CCA tRNA nucleotidyltransferase, mitochondrial [Coemansia javaensis]|uniref:CCA tRNA nucleotidyltransferase, mitochondrial n=1 Tax=Coemansia javaensis TaxID=2761396 RepID=A0A9W8HGT4_9FUNG|nr:CCA tRNA nucleotidyltransferase, mitochondrial [Coemansia javaensis]
MASDAAVALALSPKEEEFCSLLARVADSIHEQQPEQPRPTLRVAGGWVRDKLLGLESHDLDVAVDRMSGFELAQRVNAYLAAQGQAVRTIAKISQNPERSKHLETASTSVLGLAVDFVNLRSETYTGDSRIPHAEFGTPLQDALRRDITINALFYNIHTRRVEDFTGRGLADLRAGVVRTPLDPRQTFSDDPLRVLRVLRFASRFAYRIDPATAAALAAPAIAADLRRKISRERIGVELDKMAAGPSPLLAIRLILRFGLYAAVFHAPPPPVIEPPLPVIEPPLPDDAAVAATERVLCLLDDPAAAAAPPALAALAAAAAADPQIRRALVLAAYLYPLSPVAVPDGRRAAPLALVAVRDGLKLSRHDAEAVAALHALAPKIAALARCAQPAPSRRALGLLVREAGPRWPAATLFAAAVAGIAGPADLSAFAAFAAAISDHGLADAFALKHIVDGRAVADIMGIKGGPAIRVALDRIMEWQLDHPHGTAAECEAFVRSEVVPRIQSGH